MYFLISKHSLTFASGNFNISLLTSLPALYHHFNLLYQYAPKLDQVFIDFTVTVQAATGIRRWLKPQITFIFDGYEPFTPLPHIQAPALFEWGLNWCIANNAHHYLIIHAAVVEKNGYGLLMPGSPGSGKSTLCAALVCQGWRLLSDEMALLSITDGMIYPMPRPISLKNRSIQIIKQFSPDTIFGSIITDTTKGNIAHMQIPEASILAQTMPVKLTYLVFPHYTANSQPQLTKLTKSRAFMILAENAFNFNILGSVGFDAMANLVDTVECYNFTYPDLSQALRGINRLASL